MARVAREFARNAEVTEERSMIAMGAGTDHWFHSGQVYRTFAEGRRCARMVESRLIYTLLVRQLNADQSGPDPEEPRWISA